MQSYRHDGSGVDGNLSLFSFRTISTYLSCTYTFRKKKSEGIGFERERRKPQFYSWLVRGRVAQYSGVPAIILYRDYGGL